MLAASEIAGCLALNKAPCIVDIPSQIKKKEFQCCCDYHHMSGSRNTADIRIEKNILSQDNFLLIWTKCIIYFFFLQIHAFLVFCIFTIIASILMFWIILPMLVSGEKEVSWNLFFGSFLGVVAITFVVSMKGAFVAFKSSFFQYNCFNKHPHLQVEYHCQSSISFCLQFCSQDPC